MFSSQGLGKEVDAELGPLFGRGREHEPSVFAPSVFQTRAPAAPRRRLSIGALGGLAAAALIGVALGSRLPARVGNSDEARAPARAPAAASQPSQTPRLQVLVGAPEPQKPAAPTTLLPTVEPEPVAPAPEPTASSGRPQARVAPEPPVPRRLAVGPAPSSTGTSADQRATALPGAPAAAPAPGPARLPDVAAVPASPTQLPPPRLADPACAFRAADPASGCGDPDFIEIDRELYAAYEEARRAGVPSRDLRADQRDWRIVGADAAERSRAALLGAYRARIDQVWEMVEDATAGRRANRTPPPDSGGSPLDGIPFGRTGS
jgi:hypothetical protein